MLNLWTLGERGGPQNQGPWRCHPSLAYLVSGPT